MKYWFYIIPLIYIVTACSQKDKLTIEELSQNEIDKRINQFIASREQQCKENAMEIALSMADSLLKLNAVKYIEDSLKRPPLPLKPEKNIKPLPKDSVENRPFIKSDSLQ